MASNASSSSSEAAISSSRPDWQWKNFMNCHSGCALDAPSILEGSEIHQWKLHDRENQKWRLESSSTFPGAYQIITRDSETNEEFALEVKASTSASELNGAGIALAPPIGSSKHQLWWVEPSQSSANAVWISTFLDRDYVIDVMRGSMEQGGQIKLWKRNDGLNQLWRMVPTWAAGDGTMFPFLQGAEEQEVSVDFSEIGTRLKDVLETHGFAIVDNVIPPRELEGLLSEFGKDLMEVCDPIANSSPDAHPFIRSKYQQLCTAPLHEVPQLWPGGFKKPSLGASYGITQGRMAWGVRLHPNVRAIFRHLHEHELENANNGETDGLVVGMDQVFFKPKHSLVSENHTTMWGHADLNVHCPDGGHGTFTIYQSIVQLWDSVNRSNSTTVVWPKSHKNIFPQLCIDGNAVANGRMDRRTHFVRLDTMKGVLGAPEYFEDVAEDIRAFYAEQRELQQQRPLSNADRKRVSRWLEECYLREGRRVPIRAGSLVIWNSRTIHQGWDDGSRLAVPVCWEPAIRKTGACPSNPQVIDFRKLRIAASGSVSTHWASLGREHSVMMIPRSGKQCVVDESDAELCEMATRGMYFSDSTNQQEPTYVVPFTIKESRAHQYSHILELCEQLKASGDSDATVAGMLREMIKPEIVRVL